MASGSSGLPRTARAIAAAVAAGAETAAAVVDRHLRRIAALDARLHAFVEVWATDARRRAEALDARLRNGETLGPLAGVPVALKDNLLCRGQVATCGSKILDGFRSPYTATAVARLEAAGAVLIGRTNMDEFGMGSSTEHSCHGATRNPFDLARSPGGSSGGSAAAVAARMVPLALGSDTGGSVRQPAALCGISGIKPTYGRVSRFGLVAYASSLDTVAPLAVDADDLALCLGVLAGVDPHDATSLDVPVPDYAAALGDRGDRGDRGANGTNGTTADGADHADHADLHGLRVGVPREYFDDGLDHDVRTCVQDAIYTLEARGATVVDLSMPHTGYAIPTYYLIATAEASSNLARYDGVRFGARAGGDGDLDEMYRATRSAGFGAEVQRRILLGSYCLRAGYVDDWYIKAQQVRTLIRRDFERAFEQVDVIASPTSPVPAFALGDKLDDPLAMYLNDVLTTPANLAGVPALSIPCGAVPGSGLPIGLQLMAPALGEATLLRVARAFQATTGFHLLEPPL